MLKSRSQLVLFALVLSLLLPVQILACACCAIEGTYYRGSGKIIDFQLEIMKEMRFGDKAFIFSGEADLEDMAKGINLPKDSYEVNGSLVGNAWKLTFKDGSRSGVLSLGLPLRMEELKADIRDGQVSPGGGPLLYKEWRFEGPVSGTRQTVGRRVSHPRLHSIESPAACDGPSGGGQGSGAALGRPDEGTHGR
jgi:hypothetical protein